MSAKSKVKVVVIGGAGHVGSHLCEILKDDYDVYSFDNYLTGKQQNHIKGVTYITGCATVFNQFALPKFDIVYHLGEYARVEQSWKEADMVFENNNIDSVLEYCQYSGSKLIYTCSSTIFDQQGENLSPYTKTKVINRQKILDSGINYSICYLSNVYGGRENSDDKYGTLIAKFLSNYKNGIVNKVTLPGTQTRKFTHIDDVVSGILIAAKNSGDGFVIASDQEYSVLEVAEMIGKFEFQKEAKGNRASSVVNSDLIKSLGWKEKHNLKDYIKKEKE